MERVDLNALQMDWSNVSRLGSSGSTEAAAYRLKMMRLGIGSYSYVWWAGVPGYPAPAQRLTPAALLERAAALGVRVVQIADNLPLHALVASDLAVLRSRADALGVRLEVGTAGIDAENLGRYLGICRQLGSPILRTVIDHGGARPSPDEVIARLAPLVPVFERAGVTLAIENHDRFPARTLLGIVERLASSRVAICLDTSNSLGCLEGPEHTVEVLGAHVVSLHVKDVRVYRPPHHKGFIVEGRPAGDGQLDLPWILRRLRELGADPNAIVELWPPPEESIDAAVAKEQAWVEQSVRYLRTLIAE